MAEPYQHPMTAAERARNDALIDRHRCPGCGRYKSATARICIHCQFVAVNRYRDQQRAVRT